MDERKFAQKCILCPKGTQSQCKVLVHSAEQALEGRHMFFFHKLRRDSKRNSSNAQAGSVADLEVCRTHLYTILSTSAQLPGRPVSCPCSQEPRPLAIDTWLKCLLMEETTPIHPDLTPTSGARAAENLWRKASVHTHLSLGGKVIKNIIRSTEERIVSILNSLKFDHILWLCRGIFLFLVHTHWCV